MVLVLVKWLGLHMFTRRHYHVSPLNGTSLCRPPWPLWAERDDHEYRAVIFRYSYTSVPSHQVTLRLDTGH